MINGFRLSAMAFLCGVAFGQDAGANKPLRIRAILQDPVNPRQELYIQAQAGGALKLNLAAEGLVDAQEAFPINGSLNLFKSPVIDPKNPMANLAATAKLPLNASRVVVLIIPAPAGTTPPYKMAFIEDDPKIFRWGESRIVNLTPVDFALEVGEHKIKADGGKITVLPEVTKVNEYKQAQTNFYFKSDDSWVTAAERQMPYLRTVRRIFLIYKTPEAISPEVRTIEDYLPVVLPGAP